MQCSPNIAAIASALNDAQEKFLKAPRPAGDTVSPAYLFSLLNEEGIAVVQSFEHDGLHTLLAIEDEDQYIETTVNVADHASMDDARVAAIFMLFPEFVRPARNVQVDVGPITPPPPGNDPLPETGNGKPLRGKRRTKVDAYIDKTEKHVDAPQAPNIEDNDVFSDEVGRAFKEREFTREQMLAGLKKYREDHGVKGIMELSVALRHSLLDGIAAGHFDSFKGETADNEA